MIKKITGSDPFQVMAQTFAISPSAQGYEILWSADGTTYTSLRSVAADTNYTVSGVAYGSYFKLSGNTDTVTVTYGYCGGSEGGGSYTLPVASSTELGGVKIGSGISIDSEGKISANGGSGSSNYQIVSDLDEVVDPEQGTMAYVKGSTTTEEHTFEGKSIDLTQYTEVASSSFFTLKVNGTLDMSSTFNGTTVWLPSRTAEWSLSQGSGLASMISNSDASEYGWSEGYVSDEQAVEERGEGYFVAFYAAFDDEGKFFISNPANADVLTWYISSSALKTFTTWEDDTYTYTHTESTDDVIYTRDKDENWNDLFQSVNDRIGTVESLANDAAFQASEALSRPQIVALTQEEYDALETKDENTLYVIKAE